MRTRKFKTKEGENISVTFANTGCVIVKDKNGEHEFGEWQFHSESGYLWKQFGKSPHHNIWFRDAASYVAQYYLQYRYYENN
ncbi:MAG: hypothetical protein PUB73_06240 [Bacteroidales bacterium]|nr:hypothetical protein [Bacteroidales bacterium]